MTNIQTLVTNIGTLMTNIQTLVTNIGTLVTNIQTLMTNIQTLVTNIATLMTNIQTLMTNIGTLVTSPFTVHTNSRQSILIAILGDVRYTHKGKAVPSSVNLSDNPCNISFPGSAWKCIPGGRAALKGGGAS